MNVSHAWLRALAPSIEGSAQEIADRLAMLGAPVDDVVPLGRGLDAIVSARVVSARPHPNADRLTLCEVDAGGERLQVVCGAPNVEAGRSYAFAPVGAALPGGMVIRKAKIRGETSEGMLCSERELGLGREHGGIMRLDGDPEPGLAFVDVAGLDDTRLELVEARTIAGGSGAGPSFDGTAAVQTHMTNTRITDVEVLEAFVFLLGVEADLVLRCVQGDFILVAGDGSAAVEQK